MRPRLAATGSLRPAPNSRVVESRPPQKREAANPKISRLTPRLALVRETCRRETAWGWGRLSQPCAQPASRVGDAGHSRTPTPPGSGGSDGEQRFQSARRPGGCRALGGAKGLLRTTMFTLYRGSITRVNTKYRGIPDSGKASRFLQCDSQGLVAILAAGFKQGVRVWASCPLGSPRRGPRPLGRGALASGDRSPPRGGHPSAGVLPADVALQFVDGFLLGGDDPIDEVAQ